MADSAGTSALGIGTNVVIAYGDLWVNTGNIQNMNGDTVIAMNSSNNVTLAANLTVSGSTILGDASGDTVTINAATINPVNIAPGTANKVVVYNDSSLVTDVIDSRVWGSTLVDTDGSGASTRIAVFSDDNTIAGSVELTYDGSTLLLTDPASRLVVRDTTANYQVGLGVATDQNGPGIDFGDSDLSANTFMQIGSWSAINNLDTKARDFHLFGTNTTTGIYFDESLGRVGILNSTPSYTLDVAGTLRATGAGTTIAQDTWIGVTFEANWENHSATQQQCGYFKDSMGFVHLRGLAQCSSTDVPGTTIFTLPEGYRPNLKEIFPARSSDAGGTDTCRVDVLANGTVVTGTDFTPALNAWVSLAGILFDTR